MDSNLNSSETDIGKTALYVEDNKNAEGVVVVADKAGSNDRVILYNNNDNSSITMFFKSGKNFPYYMIVKQNKETFTAFLSNYKTSTSTFDITFCQNEDYQTLYGIVFNHAIFDLYQDDSGLNQSQNLRLRNITIALGICGSLYNGFQETAGITLNQASRGWFKSFLNGAKKVFTAVAVVAMVVAVVVAPIAAFIVPATAFAIGGIAAIVGNVSMAVAVTLTAITTEHIDGFPPTEGRVPVINVLNWYEQKPIQNGVEFHIGRGKDVGLEFSSPGLDNADITLEGLIGNFFPPNTYFGWEKDNFLFPYSTNSGFFTLTLDKAGLPADRFLVKIKRSVATGSVADGKVAFGFRFANDNLHINGEVQPIEYKYWDDAEPTTRTDTVVVKFCIDPFCQHYKD